MLFCFLLFQGLEDFENKIDKLAEGETEEDNSWVGRLYREYKEQEDDDDENDENWMNGEGLEAPSLDTVGATEGKRIIGIN